MTSLDCKKQMKHLYAPSAKEVSLVTVPAMKFAMVDGTGDPNTSQAFEDAVGALYGVTFTIKMLPKKGVVPDGYVEYKVPPLEGLWWIKGEQRFTLDSPKDDYYWTLMIMQPPFVTEELVGAALKTLQAKKTNPALRHVRLTEFEEGRSVQILHVGPYATEPASLQRMDDFAAANGYVLHGRHHEIYLGDPRRCAPEKLRTVLRHPVRKG